MGYLVLSVACLATSASADVKIKSRNTAGGQSSENTVYIKGKRQRTEMSGGAMTILLQCDLKRDVQIMPPAKTYLINQFNTENTDTTTTTNDQSAIRNPQLNGAEWLQQPLLLKTPASVNKCLDTPPGISFQP